MGVAVAGQAFKVYMIYKYTPVYMSSLKKVMYINAIFQTVHAIVCWLMQFRQISNMTPMEIWSYGYGQYFPPWIGYCFYHVSQSMTFGNGTMVMITLFLKTEAARVLFLRTIIRVLIISAITTPMILSMTMEVILITTRAFPSEMQEHYRQLNMNASGYTIVGVVDMSQWPSGANLGIMIGTVLALPILGVLSYRSVRSHVNKTADRISATKQAQNKLFIMGLVIQTFLPLLCYCPISCVYLVISFFTHSEFLFQQFFMFTFPAFPALLDPGLTIWFTKPYRDALKRWYTKKKVSPITMTVMPQSAGNTNSHPLG